MKKQNLVILIAAAVAVVGLVVLIPTLTGGDEQVEAVARQEASGTNAPPIDPNAEMPAEHPDIAEGDAAAGPTVEEVVAKAEETYNADPKNVEAVLNLGAVYVQASRLDDAAAKYEEALALEADNDEAIAGLAMVKLSQGEAEAAKSDLEQLVEAQPESQVGYYNLAIVNFSSNEREAAKASWQKAVDIDANSEIGLLSAEFVKMMEGSADGGSPHGATSEQAPADAK